MLRERNTVVIIGAGPAGLILGNLLRSAGIDCAIIERQTRPHIEQRARAGFLAANTVRVLEENDLGRGLRRSGRPHSACAFRSDLAQFVLDYGRLGRGEIHTVYPQQDLVRDLVAEFLDRGGDLRCGMTTLGVHDVNTNDPWIDCRGDDGRLYQWGCRFIAGCDGQHGVSREGIPAAAARRYRRNHGISWLAILTQAHQSMPAVTYAIHDAGFVGQMARSPSITRYYLQCAEGDDPEAWSDERIWEQLHLRFRAEQYGSLSQGPILERRVVSMRSFAMDPIQYGRLFLVGDAASLISPSAAKGANLAVMEAEMLAQALTACLENDDEKPLIRYSAECLPRVWRAQEFSHWMLNLLHGPTEDDPEADFLRALQRTRLENLRNSPSHQAIFADNYVGI